MTYRLADEGQGATWENVVPPIERAQEFVGWAETGAGSAGGGRPWSDRSAEVRWNLNQFWSLKAENYQENPAAWDLLDHRAHRAWAALAELGMIADNPPAQERYQREAQQAYAGAISAAERAGKDTTSLRLNSQHSGEFFSQAKAAGIDDSMRKALEDRVSELVNDAASLLGVPLWAWGLGAVGLAWVLWGRK